MVLKWFKTRRPGWRERGNEALAAGDLAAAAACYLEGTQAEPGNAAAWLNLGFAQLEGGQHPAARASLQRAESLLESDDPALADVCCLVGRERMEQGDLPAAERALRRAVGLRADFEPAVRDLARTLLQAGRDSDALPWLENYLRLQPRDAQAQLMHAQSLLGQARGQEALAACDRAIALERSVPALNLRGAILHRMGRTTEALAAHDAALAMDGNCVPALIDSSGPLSHLHRYDEALARLERALALQPGRREALVNKAAALTAQLRCREALDVLEHDLGGAAAGPDVAFQASFVRLLLGDWREGWRGYEARWQLRHHGTLNARPDFGAPEWAGEPLEGRTILLHAEQGLGDSIQSLRFVPAIAARAARVFLRVQPALWPVLGGIGERCELIAQDARPAVDFACPLMSLPALLATTLDDLPREVPYLVAPPERVAHWRERLGPARGLRVGIAWSGNPQQANDHNRSMPLAALRAAAAGGVEFISLQKEVRASDVPELRAWPALRHFGDELASFGDTAALATLVDAVVSVDTSVAHLCGALGRPLAVVLAYCPDWRWLLERSDSPWYPTARLYRQAQPGEWAEPLARAMADLPVLAALRAPASA